MTKAGEELFDAAGDVISAISSSFYTTVTGKEKPLVYLDGSQEEMRKKDLNDAPPSPYKMFIEGEDQPPQIDLSSSILEEVKLEKVAEILAKDEEEEQKLSEEELQKELEEQAQKDLEEIEVFLFLHFFFLFFSLKIVPETCSGKEETIEPEQSIKANGTTRGGSS